MEFLVTQKITSYKINKAIQVLTDNGIEPEEAYIVLQAIGYVLLDTELFPDNNNDEYEPKNNKE